MKPVAEFNAELSNAYSFPAYRNGFRGCIRMLRRRGFDDIEIEAILRSKWARWAHDGSGKRFGYVTSTDLARFLDSYIGDRGLSADLDKMIEEYGWRLGK